MACQHCGTYYQPGQRFCLACGRDLLPEQARARQGAAGWFGRAPATAPYSAYGEQQIIDLEPEPGAPARYGVPRAGRGAHGTGGARVGRLGAAGVALLALLSKAKGLLVLLKFGKFGGTFLTMLVSVAAYAAFFGFSFAVGFVALLLIHELGHWAVLRRKGVAAGAPVFIPFLGALISMRGRPRNVKDEAEIGIAGPIAGTAAALLTGIAGALAPAGHPQLLLYALAYTGLLLNLFNLIPVSPLDGGRVMAAVSRWAWPVGLALLALFFVLWPNPILLLILIIGGLETISRFRGTDRLRNVPGYYEVAPRERLTLAVLFFGLLAVAFGGMEIFHAQLVAIQGGTL